MPSGGEKPGDAKADLTREVFARNDDALDNAITRLEIRADMKSLGEEEISAVIDQRALEVQRQKESDPPSKATPMVVVLTVVRKFPAWGAVLVALAAIAAYVVLKLH